MPPRSMAPPSESQRQIQTLRRTTMTQSVAACRRLSFSGPYLSFFLNLANLIPTTSNQIEHISEAPLLTASLRRPRPGVSLNGVKSSGKHKTLRLTFRPLEIGLIQSGYSICRNDRLGAWGSCCIRRAPYHPASRWNFIPNRVSAQRADSPAFGSFTTPRLISGSVLFSIHLDQLRSTAHRRLPLFL